MNVPKLSDIPDRIAEDAFWDLLGQREHESLDFKRGVPDDILATIPAMAMTNGGLIVHGIADDRTIIGCPLSQNTADRIARFAHECGVDVQFKEIAVGDRKLTVTAVPEVRQRIVTTPDGRLLRRAGGDCQPLRGDAMARFVQERSVRSAEEEPLSRFSSDDYDLDRVNEALSADGREPITADRLARALIDLGVARPAHPPLDTQVCKAAAVLFAKDPTRFIPRAMVKLVRREGVEPGPGPTSVREECTGPLTHVLMCCLKFLSEQTKRFEVVQGLYRETLPEYPQAVLREAVLNALAHRDYGLSGSSVDITVWDDRIEVSSPGPLPAPVTVENIREEHSSRNPRLMRVLKTLGLVEEYGEGVDRMYREMETRLLMPPVFTATSTSVTVTLSNRFLVDVEDQAWLSLLGNWPMSAVERQVLVAARREGYVTRRRLREFLTDADVDAALAGAVAKGLLKRTGQRGGTRYILSEEILLRVGGQGMEAQSRRRQLLLDAMRSGNGLSTPEGARLLGASQSAARMLLNELVQAGLARTEGRTRARRYYPT